MILRLDLGAGQHPQPGFVPIDRDTVDLFVTPWPWDTSTVDQVWCSHFVEHVPNLIGFMNELWRILRGGASATIVHPYQHSSTAWGDPTHVRALNEDSWAYYNAEWRKTNGLDHYPIVADFTIGPITPQYTPWPDRLRSLGWAEEEINVLTKVGVNMIDQLTVNLIAIK